MRALAVLLLLIVPAPALAEDKTMLEVAADALAKAILGYKSDRDYHDQLSLVHRQGFSPPQTPTHIRAQTDQKLAMKTDR